jgi:membrane-associated phospholipid phosphatase
MAATSPRRSIVFEHDPLSRRAMGRMAVGAGIVVIIGCVFGLLVASASPVPAEQDALEAVADRRVDALTSLLGTVSWLGSLWLVALVTALALPLLRIVTRGWEAPWLVVLSLVGSLTVTAVVKVVVSRERPLDALTETTSAAFPSGHASRTAAMLGLGVWVVLQISRHPAVRRILAGVLIGGIGLMAFSRIYLGVHWPSDVLFGVGLGTWWLFTMLHAVRPRVTAASTVGEDDPQITRP